MPNNQNLHLSSPTPPPSVAGSGSSAKVAGPAIPTEKIVKDSTPSMPKPQIPVVPVKKPGVSTPPVVPSVGQAGVVPPAMTPKNTPPPPATPAPSIIPGAKPMPVQVSSPKPGQAAGLPTVPGKPMAGIQPLTTSVAPMLAPAGSIAGGGVAVGGSAGGGGKAPQNPQINLPKGGPGAPNPMAAKVKKSPLLKFLPFIGIGVVVLAVVAFILSKVLGGNNTKTSTTPSSSTSQTSPKTQQVELTYWGLFEDATVMQTLIDEFEKQNPNVSIRFVKQSHVDYRERLQSEIATGNGPDIFRFHASWTPMLKTDLASLPASVMNLSTYNQTFYPVAGTLLQNNGQIVGIPLMYDGLALFYNKKMLEAANATPPATWRDLQTLAKSLTVGSGSSMQRGGLAIGNAENVEHFSDILGLLILQNGGNPTNPNTQEVMDALTYYVSFAKNSPVFSTNLPSSTVAFAREEVAMMLAPSWRAHEVLAMNPDLDFGIVASPTLADQSISWASFWAEGVSSKSKNQVVAWQFLKFLSTKESLMKFYSAAKQNRAFGEIYPRPDMAAELASAKYVPAFLEMAENAQSWYLCSYTHDNGLNDQNISYYKEAIDSLLAGKQMEEVIQTLELGIKQNLAQYNVGTTTTSTVSQ